MNDIARLQRALDYEFTDSNLLELALTHRSAGKKNNERLEFLGDSIVNHIIAEALYRQFPLADEGEMSRMRANLVKGETLAELGRELELGQYLKLGPGERKSGGHNRGSIIADAFEAIAGAILLDSDVERCRKCILSLFGSRISDVGKAPERKDPKTELQEYLQGRHIPLPIYELQKVDSDDHNPQFHVKCILQKPALVVAAAGGSRRKAEQAAAELALKRIISNGK
jgi:ribonuclease-3